MAINLSIGMNIHRWGDHFVAYSKEMLETNLDTCKELGVGCIRYNNSGRGENSIEDAKYVAERVKERGMKLMLAIDESHWAIPEYTGPIEKLENYYEEYMFRISSELKGLVDIYQIFNEMDIMGMHGDIANIILPGKDGKEKGEYDSVMFERAMVSVKGALRGIKKGDPEAKTCVNFAWWHTAMIYEMYNRGCRWDITGLDWYSDCEEVSSIALLIEDVKKNIPESDLIICETNYWMHPMGRDPIEKQEALKIKENRYEGQANWVPEFIQKIIDLNEPKMKGVIFYELLDEPIYERDRGSYNGESHFGFIECDLNGENRKPKPAYYALQKKCLELKEQNKL